MTSFWRYGKVSFVRVSLFYFLCRIISIGHVIETICPSPAAVQSINGFYILLTVHHAMILGKWPTLRTNSFLCIYFLFITLYMFRAPHAHHQERQILSIQSLVTVTLCWWSCHVYDTATNTQWQLPEVVLIQFVSPDDEHEVLETCREL